MNFGPFCGANSSKSLIFNALAEAGITFPFDSDMRTGRSCLRQSSR